MITETLLQITSIQFRAFEEMTEEEQGAAVATQKLRDQGFDIVHVCEIVPPTERHGRTSSY